MYPLKYLNINKIFLKHKNFRVLGFGFGDLFWGTFWFGFGFESRPEPKFKNI